MRRGRRQHRVTAAAAALFASVIASSPAWSQSTLTGERGTPLVPEADTVPAGEFNLSTAVNLMGAMPGDRFHAAPFGLTVGLSNRLEAGVAFRAFGRGVAQGRGTEQDLSLSAKELLVTESILRPGLSLSLTADHPLQGWDFLPSVVVQKHVGPLLVAAQLGWRIPRLRRIADPAGPFYGAAAALSMSSSMTLMLQAAGDSGSGFANVAIMPGIAFSLLGPDPLEARRTALRKKAVEVARAILGDTPAQVTTSLEPAAAADAAAGPAAWTGMGLFNGARVPILQHPGRITFFATGGPALGQRATWSVFAGIQIASFDELLQDSDGDGIPDRFDKCPFEPEDWDGFEDEDGCPDHGIEVLKKLAEEARNKAVQQGHRFTTPFPQYRMHIPVGPIPTVSPRGDPRQFEAPRPKAAPPAPAIPAPAPVPPPPPERNRRKPPAQREKRKRAPPATGERYRLAPRQPPEPDPAPARRSTRLRSSPVVPQQIARWPWRGGGTVLDALRLAIDGASARLGEPERAELGEFAARAAQLGADLEIWASTSLSRGPVDGALAAGEIAAQAEQLGHLAPRRVRTEASPWVLTRGADVLVLLVAPAGAKQ